jgi:hypothetical protein
MVFAQFFVVAPQISHERRGLHHPLIFVSVGIFFTRLGVLFI